MTDDKTVDAVARAIFASHSPRDEYDDQRPAIHDWYMDYARAAIEAYEAAKGERVRKSVTVERDGDMVSVRMYGTREGGVSDDLNSLTISGRYPAPEATTSEGEMLEPGVTYTYSPSKGFKRKEDPTPAPVVVETIEDEDGWDQLWEELFQPRGPSPESVAVVDSEGKNWLAWTNEDGDTFARTIPYEEEDEEPDMMAVQGITVASGLAYPLTVLTPAPSTAVSAVVDMCRHAIAESEAHDKSEAHRPCETHSRAQFARRVLAGLSVAEDGA